MNANDYAPTEGTNVNNAALKAVYERVGDCPRNEHSWNIGGPGLSRSGKDERITAERHRCDNSR